jgi:hypothetical protein
LIGPNFIEAIETPGRKRKKKNGSSPTVGPSLCIGITETIRLEIDARIMEQTNGVRPQRIALQPGI